MIQEIKRFTEIEARQKLNDQTLTVSKVEKYCLLAIMYARGNIAKGQSLAYPWHNVWVPPFLSKTMSKHGFKIFGFCVLMKDP